MRLVYLDILGRTPKPWWQCSGDGQEECGLTAEMAYEKWRAAVRAAMSPVQRAWADFVAAVQANDEEACTELWRVAGVL